MCALPYQESGVVQGVDERQAHGQASRFLPVSCGTRHSLCVPRVGQALIEYALIISLIALVAITALQTTGTNVAGILNTIAGEV